MVYLICLSSPLQRKSGGARHYIGYSPDAHTLGCRVRQHCQGKGARFTQVAVERGIELNFVRLWAEGDRRFERQLKRQKNARRYCPICNSTK